MASLLNKSGRPYGGCRPEATPTPPWWNFSSARTIEYTAAGDGSGMVKTHIRERQQIFTGLPRPVWPNCTKIRPSEQHLPGESQGIDDPDGRLYTSDNPLRLADKSLLVQVAVCLGDRLLGWGGSCGINGSSGPCQAPTQVIYRSVDEGAVWSFQGVLSNPADYPEVTDMKESFHFVATLLHRARDPRVTVFVVSLNRSATRPLRPRVRWRSWRTAR